MMFDFYFVIDFFFDRIIYGEKRDCCIRYKYIVFIVGMINFNFCGILK